MAFDGQEFLYNFPLYVTSRSPSFVLVFCFNLCSLFFRISLQFEEGVEIILNEWEFFIYIFVRLNIIFYSFFSIPFKFIYQNCSELNETLKEKTNTTLQYNTKKTTEKNKEN